MNRYRPSCFASFPPVPEAQIESITVRPAEDTTAEEDVEDPLGWHAVNPALSRDAPSLQDLAGQPLRGQGELYVGIHDPLGRHHVTRTPLYYHDLPIGRILITISPSGLTVIDRGAPDRIAARLRERRRDLTCQA